MIDFGSDIAIKLNLKKQQVEAALSLLEEDATIPFIARYRKDKTGALDEVQIQKIQEEARFLKEFTDRKSFIEKTISEQEKMTEELQIRLNNAVSISELEDIYLPYKPKRKTKGQTARENGLEALANQLMAQNSGCIEEWANKYMSDNVKTTAEALQGARDIIAELINEDTEIRAALRKLFEQHGLFISQVMAGKEEEGKKYKDYFAFSEAVSKVPSHRVLAVLRGFMEGVLKIEIAPVEETALALIEKKYLLSDTNEAGAQVKKAIKEAYRRLLQPSLESEFRTQLKQAADEEAINVFAENLRQLLLSSPLGRKKILAIDPGYRTGCKIVVLDDKGELQATALIYVHEKNHRLVEAENTIRNLIHKYDVAVFAVGDGTAGRETEQFIKSLKTGLPVYLVNEDGASVYSASEIAREEFPEQDVTVRGAISIGRRLMDPLAELVKIDPKSIGVGQYQHDVNQFRLKERLDQTVESCVNTVGVNLNTASKKLLSYVSGIGSSLAENIVQYRSTKGDFVDRKELLNVNRMGTRAFEQCAGFLRIPTAKNPLDASAVHPESYSLVKEMADDKHIGVKELIGNEKLLNTIEVNNYVTEKFGAHTIKDILMELKKPGLDPRTEIENFEYAEVYTIEDLKLGDVLPGIVTNITRFGVFVDIGVKQDGLVHVSELANRYITDPNEVVKLNEKVKVKVLEIDASRKRIALSIRQTEPKTNVSTPKAKKERPTAKTNNMQDALSLLRKKFDK